MVPTYIDQGRHSATIQRCTSSEILRPPTGSPNAGSDIGLNALRTMAGPSEEQRRFQRTMVVKRITAIVALTVLAAGCTSIKNHRGYIVDQTLMAAVQPGIDNRQSVEQTLGRPTFTSEFGQPTWYYVSSTTQQRPFGSPRIAGHNVLAVQFDASGNVAAVDRSGMDRVARINPDGDSTPTLGRERGFLEDLFGNIGQVGAPWRGWCWRSRRTISHCGRRLS